MNRKVLIIAYDFPPKGITSSRRTGCMAKYLRDFGWEPIVVTPRWTPENSNYDPTIVSGMPNDLAIYYIDLDGSSTLHRRIKDFLIRAMLPQLHPFNFVRQGRTVIDRVLREHKIDAVWVSAPPSNVLDLARYASSKADVPWVADFRDVWQWIPNTFVRMTFSGRMRHERAAIASAAAVTTVSEGFANTLRRRHCRDALVISHGFDEAPAVDGRVGPTRFEVVYTGSLVLGNPDVSPVMDAVEQLIEEGKVEKDTIRISFYGANNEAAIRDLIKERKHGAIVVNHGHVAREHALRAQAQASVLLIATHPGMPGWITSKVYEYLAAKKPILAVPRDNDCIDEILQVTNAGVSLSGASEIKDKIEAWYNEWRDAGIIAYAGDGEAISRYSRRSQAEQLARLLSAVTTHVD